MVYHEGFWKSDYHKHLPMPRSLKKPWIGKAKFLKALYAVESKARGSACKGSSICRICNKLNGSETFRHKDWEWPSGFEHYIEEHNVRPSTAFIEFITGESQV